MWIIAYVLIGPCGGRALTVHAHAGALFTASLIVTLEVVEAQFAAVAVFSFYVFLRVGHMEGEREQKDEELKVWH